LDDLEALAKIVFNSGLELHKELGPGLLESVYKAILADMLVEKGLLIELKSTEHFAPVHAKQVLTYIRLAKLPLGFLMNFGQATFVGGFKRLANDYYGKIDG
jgi:PD-(D/E)XK nuclease superfamily